MAGGIELVKIRFNERGNVFLYNNYCICTEHVHVVGRSHHETLVLLSRGCALYVIIVCTICDVHFFLNTAQIKIRSDHCVSRWSVSTSIGLFHLIEVVHVT